MRDLLKVMKSLSDGTRVRILNLLMQRECCVCEVMEVLGITQSTASRGLAALYDAGILKRRRLGTRVLFSIDHEAAPYCQALLHALQKALERDETCLRDRDRLQQLSPAVADCVRHQPTASVEIMAKLKLRKEG
jgi:ArsR family transcriptional regulator